MDPAHAGDVGGAAGDAIEPGSSSTEAFSGAADAALMRRRLLLAIPVPAVFLLISLPLLGASRPGTSRLLATSYALELGACVACFFAARSPRLQRHLSTVALVFGGSFALLLAVLSALLAVPAELLALTLVCELTGLAVLLPWGVREQTLLSIVALLALLAVGPFLPSAEGIALPAVGVVAGATSAVAATALLERFRRDARRRERLLRIESSRKQDELDVSTALLRMAETLSTNAGRDEVFALANRLAAEVVGTDWSGTFFFDDGGALRLVSQSGVRPALAEQVRVTPFPAHIWALTSALARGEVVEIADADRQDLAPPETLHLLEIASVIYAPIFLGTELVGTICNGNRERKGAFSEKQRRMTVGIARALAMGVANHRLISDLRDANRLKSDFVSTMSHELRTPLNVITGYADMLRDPDLGSLSPEHTTAAAGIRRSAGELLDLVTKTLDLSRLELGADSLRLERVRVRDLFREVEAELAGPIAERGLRVSYAEEASAPIEIVTDRGKLKTIAKNLVGNAVKFTPAGEISVHASCGDGRLVVRVRDTGVGIPPEDRDAVFEMFRQLAPGAGAAMGGVGLGLYIVKRLTDLLGGSIALASTPGEGSEFTLDVPVRSVEEWSEAGDGSGASGTGASGSGASSTGAARTRNAATVASADAVRGAVAAGTAASGAGARSGARGTLVRRGGAGYKRGA